jgi:outer membrane protein OmpA-like peptidoglycan-associated protein
MMNKNLSSIFSGAVFGVMTVATFLFATPDIKAQETAPRNEFSVTLQGGLAAMPFKGPVTWNSSPGPSLGGSANFTHWFNQRLGFRTGLRLYHMSHEQRIENLDIPISPILPLSSIGIVGGSGLTTVVMRAYADAVNESQEYTFVELPLQLAMRFKKLHLNFGVSFAKALSASGNNSYERPHFTLLALPDLGVTMPDAVPVTFDGNPVAETGVMNKPLYCLLDAEVGYKFPLSYNMSLMLGFYSRLAPVAKKVIDPVETFDIMSDATYVVARPSKSTLVDKVGYYELGFDVGVCFGKYSEKKKQKDIVVINAMSDSIAAAKALTDSLRNEIARMSAEMAANEKACADNLAAVEKAAAADRAAAEKAAAYKAEADKSEAEGLNADKAHRAFVEKVGRIQINFDFDKTEPHYDDVTDVCLHDLCDAMKNDPSIKVVVVGHCDSLGTDNYNTALGERRAERVKQLMIDLGAPAANIQTVTRGKRNPIKTNDTKEGRAENRRVTVELKD